jgi:hypothetical protein
MTRRELRPFLCLDYDSKFGTNLNFNISDSVQATSGLKSNNRAVNPSGDLPAHVSNQQSKKGFGAGKYPA